MNEVIAMDIDAGNAFVLSSEALGLGTGPSAGILSGLACDSANSRLLLGDRLTATASILAVDMSTGNRSVISDTTTGTGNTLVGPTVLAASPDGIAAFAYDGGGVVRVDMAYGNRSEFAVAPFGRTVAGVEIKLRS